MLILLSSGAPVWPQRNYSTTEQGGEGATLTEVNEDEPPYLLIRYRLR